MVETWIPISVELNHLYVDGNSLFPRVEAFHTFEIKASESLSRHTYCSTKTASYKRAFM